MIPWVIGVLMAATLGGGAPPAGPEQAQLRVATIPDGAMVSCDGILYEAAPLTIGRLAPGEHLVAVEKPGFAGVRRTVSLGAGQKAAVEIKLEPVLGLVLVRSVPDGTTIKIDGVDRGKTPLLLTDIPVGRHRVAASCAGFVPKDVELTVEGRTPQALDINLASDSAKLTIVSTPAGATVVVNGLSKGVTPCEIERLPAGENDVSVTLAGYVSFQQKVKLQAGEEQKIETILAPEPASLSIISTPAGARVFIDDKLVGQAPVAQDTLAPGTHAVRAELAGYEPQQRSVELQNRERRVEEFQLVRNAGTLDVMTDQPETKVAVDGSVKGTILASGDRPSEPLKIELPVGNHVLSLSKKGYSTVERTVAIKKGETLTVREVMKRKFVPDTSVRTRAGAVEVGCLGRKLPNGDIELETQAGIFKTIKGEDVLSVDPIVMEETRK
jgi:hypothetical protein